MKETLCRSPPGAAIVGGRHVNTTIDHWVTLHRAITGSHVGWFSSHFLCFTNWPTQATESGGSVLGTKEPDWIAALAPTQNQVRA